MTDVRFDPWTGPVPKGTYHSVATTAIQRTVRVACPSCAKAQDVTRHHITPEGVISPPLLCPCGFHDTIRLVGWTEPRPQMPTARRSRAGGP